MVTDVVSSAGEEGLGSSPTSQGGGMLHSHLRYKGSSGPWSIPNSPWSGKDEIVKGYGLQHCLSQIILR